MTFSAAARMSTLKRAVNCRSAKTHIALPIHIHRKAADFIGGLFSHCLDKGYAVNAGFCNLLSVMQSMSRAGNPYDNAVMESFWGRFKDVLRCRFHYWERDDLHGVIAEAIHYFNFCRPLRNLNGKPPALFRTVLAA